MKLEYLIVIFMLIIIPINIVFANYIDTGVNTLKMESEYDKRLYTATYDAVKSFQLNTIKNTYSDINTKKIITIEDSASTFFTSLASNFGLSGYNEKTMREYVPAIVYTMYDGYYLYTPFVNVLTGVDEYDESYSKNNEVVHGVKPYVYYSCRYTPTGWFGENDFVITYTLDNYITIDGIIRGKYRHLSGYILPVGNNKGMINKKNNKYVYDGLTINMTDSEALSEYLSDGKLYYYVKINGTKYYYYNSANNDLAYSNYNYTNENDYIFFIDSNGNWKKQVNIKGKDTKGEFKKYYQAIFKNTSGYNYYKNAYEFSNTVLDRFNFNLISLKVTDSYEYKHADADGKKKFLEKYNVTTTNNLIFDGLIQESDSNFNQHRSAVIRNVIESNLSTSISAYKNYSGATNVEFIMPKISETDWELLENNICITSFMQGISIGGKVYNGYSVVPNNLNKEHVDENDIYILTTNGEYTRANDSYLVDGTVIIYEKDALKYFSASLNINFENRIGQNGKYYNSMRINPSTPFYASYSGLIGSSSLNDITYADMYKYMKGIVKDKDGNKIIVSSAVKKAYYMALGRERYSAFNINNELEDLLNSY